jgi:molecular chaperone GrpE
MNDAEREPEQAETGHSPAPENLQPEPVSYTPGPDEQQKAFNELNDRFLRLAADFENYKRRVSRERESVVALANERFAIDMIEVLDNLDRALKSDDSHLREGLEQIRQLFITQIGRHGITSIESLQKPFNPGEHEAVAHVPSGEPEGIVIDEVICGYKMNERVIRHAKVAVSKANQDLQR